MDSLAEMRKIISTERESLSQCIDNLQPDVSEVVNLLFNCTGRIVVMGLGKCAYIGGKISATMASTGTLAVFVHPAEALHGDLGYISSEDVVLILSNSGETAEICAVLPHLKHMGVPIIGLTAGKDSTLTRYCQKVIDTGVPREADPLGMVPTSSTTVMLAVGDALALVLMKKRGFDKAAYGRLHPGGSLGARLLCLVEELMHRGEALPVCKSKTPVREAIVELSSKRLGAVFVVDEAGKLVGIFTDGDLRRALEHHSELLDMCVEEVMSCSPKVATAEMLAADALRLMEDNLITVLPVVRLAQPIGAIHMHDLIKRGIQA